MLRRYLFGDDVFISYSRRDGAAYAAALANALSRDAALTCFLDQWGASAARELSPPVLRALDRCHVLVLIGTPNVAASTMVREELARFSTRPSWAVHRPLIPINVDHGLDGVAWSELEGLHRVVEPCEAHAAEAPSAAVVRLIRDSCTFRTRNQRVRRLSFGAAGLLLVSLVAGGLALDRSRAARLQERAAMENARRADEQAALAGENATKAEEQRRLADASTRRAEQEAESAKASARRATEEQQRAEQQARLAAARELAASAALKVQTGNGLPEGVRLAVRAMQADDTTSAAEAYQTLRQGLAVLPRMVTRMPHDGAVRFASLGADGRMLATADFRTIRVWDVRQGRVIASRAYGAGVFFTGLALSPDARLLAVGYGGTLEVLMVPAIGAAQTEPVALADVVFRPALRQPERPTFSANGRYFAAIGTAGGLSRVWTVGDWTERATHAGGRALAFSPDGAYLFIAGPGWVRTVVPDAAGAEVATLAIPPAPVVAFSEDGSHLAIATPTSVLLWRWTARARAWEGVATLTHQGRPTVVAVHNDGSRVSVGSEDGSARVWTVADQREVLRATHTGPVTAAVFSRDASAMVTAGEDRAATLWDTTLDASTRRLPHRTAVRALAFANADGPLWTLAHDGQLRSWSGPGADARLSEAAPAMVDVEVAHTVLAAAFDPTSRHAGVAISDGTIFLWDLATGTSREWTVDDEVTGMAVSPTGDRVALAGERLEVWAIGAEPADGRRIPLEAFAAQAVAFSADGRFLASGAASEIRVYDAGSARPTRRVRIAGDVGGLLFSGNGDLVMADDRGRLLVWRWRASGSRPASVVREPGAIGAMALGDRDRLVAYVLDGRVVVVRDLATRRELARLTEEAEVLALGFGPDGRELGLASADGVARVVRWRPSDLIREAERRLPPARSGNPRH